MWVTSGSEMATGCCAVESAAAVSAWSCAGFPHPTTRAMSDMAPKGMCRLIRFMIGSLIAPRKYTKHTHGPQFHRVVAYILFLNRCSEANSRGLHFSRILSLQQQTL